MGCIGSSYKEVTVTNEPLIEKYVISHHRWISLIQSILPSPLYEINIIEQDIGYDIDLFYQRFISGKTRVSTGNLSTNELYVYAGVIGLYYGPNSHKYENITTNIIQYNKLDTTWLKSKLHSLYLQCNKPFEYTSTFDERDVTVIDDDSTILLLYNFATGEKRSAIILEEAKRVEPDISIIIHGGGTYFSGTAEEHYKNLIQPIKSVFPNAMVRALRGTNDIFSGPDGFDYVKRTIGQNASYFSIRNQSLIIQGIDTSNQQIYEEEVQWHTRCIKEADKQNKKIITFSYHDPITENKFLYQLKEIVPFIDAYFFGDKHTFMLYKDYPYEDTSLKKPRLIGHGGNGNEKMLDEMYTSSDKIIPGDEWHIRHNGTFIDNGFCVLTCKKNVITLNYYTIHFTVTGNHYPAHLIYKEIV